jgi:hypothetical protein
MKRSSITVDWYPEQEKEIREWFDFLGLRSEASQVEHLIRIGKVLTYMMKRKVPDGQAARNALEGIGRAFIKGDFVRADIVVPAISDKSSPAEAWRKALAMNKSEFGRHAAGIAMLMYEMMAVRPLTANELVRVMAQIGNRLMAHTFDEHPRESVRRYDEWRRLKDQKLQSSTKKIVDG